MLSATPLSGDIRLMWHTLCKNNRFKLLKSKSKVIYVDSALAKRSGYQFKHCVFLNLLNSSSLLRYPSVIDASYTEYRRTVAQSIKCVQSSANKLWHWKLSNAYLLSLYVYSSSIVIVCFNCLVVKLRRHGDGRNTSAVWRHSPGLAAINK